MLNQDCKCAEDNYDILVNLMENKAATAYTAIPEWFFVVLEGKIVYGGTPRTIEIEKPGIDTKRESLNPKEL